MVNHTPIKFPWILAVYHCTREKNPSRSNDIKTKIRKKVDFPYNITMNETKPNIIYQREMNGN